MLNEVPLSMVVSVSLLLESFICYLLVLPVIFDVRDAVYDFLLC